MWRDRLPALPHSPWPPVPPHRQVCAWGHGSPSHSCKEKYIGSANLTGAGIGMKTDNKRNFEAGILTDDTEIVEQAMNQFDEVWMGKFCKTCKRRDFCIDPIV